MATKKHIVLDELDQNVSLDKKHYKKHLKELQLRMLQLQSKLRYTQRTVILAVEGPDAAGKGGAIKRLSERLDPRAYRVYSITKPTAEEYKHHYMRRFWLRLPQHGQIGVFDRSWYGRLLVERVEGFATKEEWKRAYDEINDFEKSLFLDGAIIFKFYLYITKEEQLERFRKRKEDPYKQWKINDEDWRNREKWEEHNQAAEDMFKKTSTDWAPWHVIPANSKKFARIRMLETVVQRLETEEEIANAQASH